MPASYPTAKKTFSTLTDNVEDVLAVHQNEPNDEITAIEAGLLEGLQHPLRLAAATEVTIASGAITASKGYLKVDTEADAAADDLDTITPGTHVGEGSIVILRAENVARVVTVKDGTGNLLLRGDYLLNATDRTITLIYDGTNWRELARAGVTLTVSDLPTSGEWLGEDVEVSAGGGTEKFKFTGLIDYDDTQAANVGAGEDTLRTFTVPANTLNAAGRTLRFRAVGTLAANTNAKQVRVRWGGGAGTVVAHINQNSASLTRWEVTVELSRIGANSQRVVGRAFYHFPAGTSNTPHSTMAVATDTQTDSANVDLVLTGEGVADNDIVYEASWIEMAN